MIIDEAITDLSIQLEVQQMLGEEYQVKALRLGIEALKREKARREGFTSIVGTPLPGETENEAIKTTLETDR